TVANFLQEQFGNEQSMDRMLAEKPGVVRRVLDAIKNWIASVKSRLTTAPADRVAAARLTQLERRIGEMMRDVERSAFTPGPLPSQGGDAIFSAMYRNPAQNVEEFYDFALNNRENQSEKNKSFFTHTTPNGSSVDLASSDALHIKNDHPSTTGAELQEILDSIDSIADAYAENARGHHDGQIVKLKTDTPSGSAGILLELAKSGRVFVDSAFHGSDKAVEAWQKKRGSYALAIGNSPDAAVFAGSLSLRDIKRELSTPSAERGRTVSSLASSQTTEGADANNIPSPAAESNPKAETQSDFTKSDDSTKTALTRENIERGLDKLPKYSIAYHGTPYAFDEFLLDHIGSGEGAQAHGWGLYFAADREVARGYGDMLAKNYGIVVNIDFEGAALRTSEQKAKYYVGQAIQRTLDNNWSPDIEAAKKFADAGANANAGNADEWADAFALLNENRIKTSQRGSPGNVYTVEVPDEDVMLNEQLPLSEQPEKVRAAIGELAKKHPSNYADWKSAADTESAENVAAYELNRAVRNNETGLEIYYALKYFAPGSGVLSVAENADEGASRLLNDIGIKGIAYDGREDGKSYVVFDDKAIKILGDAEAALGGTAMYSLSDDEAAENKRAVAAMAPVATLTGDEFRNESGTLLEKVSRFFERTGNVENPDIGAVALTRSGIKDSLSHGFGSEKITAFAAVPDVLREGKIIQSTDNYEGRNYDTFVIAAPVTINKTPYFEGVVVMRQESNNIQRYYVHEVWTENEETDARSQTDVTQNGKLASGSPASTVNSVLQELWNVKREISGADGAPMYSASDSLYTQLLDAYPEQRADALTTGARNLFDNAWTGIANNEALTLGEAQQLVEFALGQAEGYAAAQGAYKGTKNQKQIDRAKLYRERLLSFYDGTNEEYGEKKLAAMEKAAAAAQRAWLDEQDSFAAVPLASEVPPPDAQAAPAPEPIPPRAEPEPQPEPEPEPEPTAPEPAAPGSPTRIVASDGTKIDGRYDVVPAGELVTSDTFDGAATAQNPGYPQQLQNRDRSSAGAIGQINSISQSPDAERLITHGTDASSGAPIVLADNVVLSGNGRVMGLAQAAKAGRLGEYHDYLAGHADEYGLDAASIPADGILVRKIDIPLDEATRLAPVMNTSGTQMLGAREQAATDSAML
ncbi:MAG: hypothetical protein LBJ84_05080, partial [Oscillospiraceae bacterium]|nr:hypothetical protein [Oscillospiraceae bacterium]